MQVQQQEESAPRGRRSQCVGSQPSSIIPRALLKSILCCHTSVVLSLCPSYLSALPPWINETHYSTAFILSSGLSPSLSSSNVEAEMLAFGVVLMNDHPLRPHGASKTQPKKQDAQAGRRLGHRKELVRIG